uniref:Uncharacterized protein n=1 Tax=Pyxicephalus adspersus TaxID=30357 RepID=A0AAV3AGF5_PYXAD|nr:TPA: hypothetical protein GDO54_014365 [Pyxicephalus adspersus]
MEDKGESAQQGAALSFSPSFLNGAERCCKYSARSCIMQSFVIGKDRKRSFPTTIIARVYAALVCRTRWEDGDTKLDGARTSLLFDIGNAAHLKHTNPYHTDVHYTELSFSSFPSIDRCW